MDGDGCFYLGIFVQNPKDITVYDHSIQSVSVKKPVLDIFNINFGGFIRQKPDRARHKRSYCWTIKTKKSLDFARLISPFLTDKRLQCAMYIQFCESICFNNFKTVDPLIIEKRKNLIIEIRKEKHMNYLITKEIVDSLKEKTKTVPINEQIDYPYFAGLMDSEGCFRIKRWKPKKNKESVYCLTIEIGNTRFPILEWVIERFGGNICFSPAKEKRKAIANWSISSAALYEILPKIRPYLINKKEVCDKLIEFQKTILSNGGDRHSELFHALFEKNRAIRERIIDEVHEFNLKGSH